MHSPIIIFKGKIGIHIISEAFIDILILKLVIIILKSTKK